uniref:Uncharacterized protein n=1 Tax=Strombidium rassoulzadegani TaxID=1082188 RepID=A0A7S3CU92_9SPIT|mmetsp:Transcript_8882/g.15076  ORF Transcript_8882/g.15076 Transcript_8882/m.15076 type:complete len:142 (+) Transcript_8882:28-453(+)
MSRKSISMTCLVALVASVQAATELEEKWKSFANQSSNKNEWTDVSLTGMVVGYGVFFLLYVYTIGFLIYDLAMNVESLDKQIEKDVNILQGELNVHIYSDEFRKRLSDRLNGIKEEEDGDDQLLTEALKLTKDKYEKYMKK